MMDFLIVGGVVLIGAIFIFFTEKEAKKQSKRIDEVCAKYLANWIDIVNMELREKQELNQKLARIENLLHHFIEQKAPRVSDAVDDVIAGKRPITVNPNCSDRVSFGGNVDDCDPAGIGFEVSRGTPFQKEQRAAGNAVSAGIPHGIIEPKFKIGDHVQVIGTQANFIVDCVLWNDRLGYYTYSDSKDVSTVTIEPLLAIFEGS